MSSQRSRGGFRLLYPSAEPSASGHATLCYVVDHGRRGDYEMTVITPSLSKRMSHDDFRTDITPRSQGIDPPTAWADAAEEAWTAGRVGAVQHVLRRLTPRHDEAREYRDHVHKNKHLSVTAAEDGHHG